MGQKIRVSARLFTLIIVFLTMIPVTRWLLPLDPAVTQTRLLVGLIVGLILWFLIFLLWIATTWWFLDKAIEIRESGSNPPRREQRYFGLRRPTQGGRADRDLRKEEQKVINLLSQSDEEHDAISHLGLSTGTFYALVRAGFIRISQLQQLLRKDPTGMSITIQCRNFGPMRLAELREKLERHSSS